VAHLIIVVNDPNDLHSLLHLEFSFHPLSDTPGHPWDRDQLLNLSFTDSIQITEGSYERLTTSWADSRNVIQPRNKTLAATLCSMLS
jgi:hypothetical protein